MIIIDITEIRFRCVHNAQRALPSPNDVCVVGVMWVYLKHNKKTQINWYRIPTHIHNIAAGVFDVTHKYELEISIPTANVYHNLGTLAETDV